VPEVDEKDSLIHGRVVDENRRGWSGLVVFLADLQGKIIQTLGKAETQDSGYYALIIRACRKSLKPLQKKTLTGLKAPRVQAYELKSVKSLVQHHFRNVPKS